MTDDEERPHRWAATGVENQPGDDVVALDWLCVDCGKKWGTYSGVTMPNWESGECAG